MSTARRTLQLLDAHRGALLRIGMIAPPWIAVPPPGYGGIEAVVDLLCEELVARGHEVTLFAAPGSRSAAHVRTLLETPHPDAIGSSLHESDHVACAFDAIEEAAVCGEPFDVVHDHSGFTAVAMASRIDVPVVHTLHAPLDADRLPFYRRHAHKVCLVAISRSQVEGAPPEVRVAGIVPNPIAVDRWPLGIDKDDYVLWIGRLDPVKGAHRAIEASRLAGRRLVIAGPVQSGQAEYFRDRVAPHVDGDRVQYIGEVAGAARQKLFARAAALLMPIRWQEPFGMVMIEALACGTPVIAFAEGAAREIVTPGLNGMLVADEAEMARAIAHAGEIDPIACRRSARTRYDIAICTDGYERVYRSAAGPPRPSVSAARVGPGHSDRRLAHAAAPAGSASREESDQ